MIVRYRAFPLHPETPEEGQALEDLFRTSPEKIAAMLINLKRTASDLGLPFGPRAMTYNSRLAQELGLWADSLGKGRDFHHAAFHAYFVLGKNLAKQQVLRDICDQAGLPAAAAGEVLANRSFAAAVDRDWQAARELRVTAVPTFILGDHSLVGAQPYEALLQLARQGGAVKRTAPPT